MEYNFSDIEEEVKAFWKQHDVYRVEIDHSKPKYYALDFFPYPSGAGLHVGHPLGYIACDIFARYKRLKGFNVLHPMGFDSFGLPAEQYAIQTGQHPALTTEKNIQTFKEQLDKIGFSFDWSREIRTSDPSFYKWTQWIFIKLFHSWYNKATNKAEPINELVEEFAKNGNSGVNAACDETKIFSAAEWSNFSAKEKSDILLNYRIAYLADSIVNWCAALGTVLANDEVKDGVSERGGYPVERKLMKQWSLRITAYAERLLQDLEKIEWSEAIKESQRNWIGRSEGCSIEFRISDSGFRIEVFTTRPDTIFGATFITLAPEHDLIQKIATPEYKKEVEEYVAYAKNRSERERMTDVKKITGQFTGAYAIHPFTQKLIAIWIGEYVLATYGTGAVMGVPGHDERDHRFASHFGLPIISILEGVDVSESAVEAKEGIVCNSDFLNGLQVKEAIKKAIDEIERRGIGKRKVNYKLRDAIFGRQRYWGEPIPIYYDEGIPHTVDENDLPLVLPEVDKYLPTESGEPPLARAKDWYYTPHNDPSLTPPPEKIGINSGERTPSRGSQVLPFGEDLGGVGKPGYVTANEKTYRHLKGLPKEFREKPTEAEKKLWEELKGDKLGEHFRRQHVIGNFIADFVCLKKKLIVEVDGGIHLSQVEEDKAREEALQEFGYIIIRFTNEEVLEKMPKVLAQIKRALHQSDPSLTLPEGERTPTRGSQVLPFGEALGGVGKSDKKFPLETTTMPGWAGSNWYYLRYEDPHNDKELASKEAIDYWQNVDLYLGGDEHATGHLMYFRFCTKFLFDIGVIPFDEPAKKLVNQGKIQGVSQKGHSPKLIGISENTDEPGKRIIHHLEVDGRNDLSKLLAGIDIEIDEKNKEYDMNIFFSADVIDDNVEGLYPRNIPIEYVDNNQLNIPKYVKSLSSHRHQINIFITNDGYWMDDKFYGEDKQGKFITTSAVEKMSKRFRNVVDPVDIVTEYGADAFRMYEMFLGPLEQSKPWDTKGIDGVFRFLKKFWKLFFDEEGNFIANDEAPTKDELKILHRTIKKVGDDVEALSFNTSVSAFMICVNELTQRGEVSPSGRFRGIGGAKKKILEPLLIILSPYAPFITEFLWQKLGHTTSITQASFPAYDPSLLVETSFEYPEAVNGKTRVKMNFDLDLPADQIEKEVITAEALQKYFDGKTPKKVIVVKGKMINIVI